MDQIKIGKFIAARRKQANLTQLQLADQLGITDRAISKWETGKALPDSSIMLQLCDVLGITVNDLLSGEVVTMDQYNKELENKLLAALKEKEESDRHLLRLEVVVGVFSTLILLVPTIVGALLPEGSVEDWVRLVIVFSGFIPGLVGFYFALRIEQTAGYYQCQKCGHRYVPTAKAVFLAPHMSRTRKMRCPQCKEKSWQKKVLTKE